ncbi:glutamate racemase [Sphingobacterium sp. SGL-16]|uniref:glutamate racemase n=1 Tax=Sphingobacterium sp. SGL-16 TaxID=2710883 RepID=UPI0013EAEFAD|nr:aspartate/glutamate racemase family protein [Sphingobacterium sp. SGL-16]NGM72394.1 Asp/Glu/hydantoin racemase [Sphingobacterium sp. SGL-16]
MNKSLFKIAFLAGLCFSLKFSVAQTPLKIEENILKEPNNYYYINFQNYATPLNKLPIGVFDSGTGGLTVLDALVNFDQFNNHTKHQGKDGILDFESEKFIYLADQANMPYGNYNATGKDDLLKEHIIKDFQFLLSNKYYQNSNQTSFQKDKEQVKAIVIACNTATAYGYEDAVAFLNTTGLNIPVIGVINAAARGTLSFFDKKENGSIAVFATVGTIASKGYERTLRQQIVEGNFTGDIEIFNQGGYGLAEAVDEEPDFIRKNVKEPRKEYRGPSLDNPNYRIDQALLEVYNFKKDNSSLLCDNQNVDDCSIIQLNDAENYVRYHLVSLMEQMRKADKAQPLKAIILGCTHYPFLIKEIKQVFDELRNYKGKDGNYVYRNLISENLHIIDPSVYVAQELYTALNSKSLFNDSKNPLMTKSEFYISVPNVTNKNVKLDAEGRFTYDYKYGRNAGEIQEYVKVVPFDRKNISEETLKRFESLIPNTYKLIQNFSKENPKTKYLKAEEKI